MPAAAKKPLVIPIFIPHQGCPHKCAFCDQSIITSNRPALPHGAEIRRQVDTWLAYRGDRRSVELAFFGGNFLGLAPGETRALLQIAQQLIHTKKIHAVRCSTRPDTIREQSLDLASQFTLDTVEIGVQSMDNQVLSRANRGHTAQDTIRAARLLDDYKITKGMQIMVGLPGDTPARAVETARAVADLKPAFVRIYPLMVLKNSRVHHWYTRGKYTPMDLDDCVTLVAAIHEIFEDKGIPVIRMGLQASDLLQDRKIMVAGPWHPAFGHLVFARRMLNRVIEILDPVADPEPGPGNMLPITLKVHPATVSQLRGDRNRNLEILKARYPRAEIKIAADPLVPPGRLTVDRPKR